MIWKVLLIVFGSFLFPAVNYAQDYNEVDSLNYQICLLINENVLLESSTIYNMIHREHLDVYISQQEDLVQDSIYKLAFYRLQKNCPRFTSVLSDLLETKGDWKKYSHKPPSQIAIEDCNQFFENSNYYYIGADESRVNVVLSENSWTDNFIDSTYSKLKLNKQSECTFNIEFISSNNETRRAMSSEGDLYHYEIIYKKETYFRVVLLLEEHQTYYAFNMYFE